MHAAQQKLDREALAAMCRQFHVSELSVFGSVARGEAQPDSDIDIMVVFDSDAKVGMFAFAQLAESLEQLTGRRVDLVTKNGLKPWIRDSASVDAQVLYAR
jgi:predicted nucleotidyltransferase